MRGKRRLTAGNGVEAARRCRAPRSTPMLGARACQRFADRRQAYAAARRLKPEQTTQRCRDADRPATVGGMRHRQTRAATIAADPPEGAAGREEVLAPGLIVAPPNAGQLVVGASRTRWCWCARRSPGRLDAGGDGGAVIGGNGPWAKRSASRASSGVPAQSAMSFSRLKRGRPGTGLPRRPRPPTSSIGRRKIGDRVQ